MILEFGNDRTLQIAHPGDIPAEDLAEASPAMVKRCADYERTIAELIHYLAFANRAPEGAPAYGLEAARRAYAETLSPSRQ